MSQTLGDGITEYVDRNEWFATRATPPTSVASTVVRQAGTASSRECWPQQPQQRCAASHATASGARTS